ncbi:MAG: HAD family hydrolase [Spirochaetaceae bacterium]|nr:MAG: HAD family hydrolase [Spirochaetaceae bacterium]
MAVRALLFDLDGTLLDTLSDIARVANRVLARHRLPTHATDAYRMMVGSGMRELVCRAVGPGDSGSEPSDALVDRLAAEIKDEYATEPVVLTKPYDGIADALAKLGAIAGGAIGFAVLSNKPDPLVRRIVDAFFAPDTFRYAVGQRPGFPAKPDPASLIHLVGLMDAQGRALYVGDSDVDVQTARAAGVGSVGAAWGFRGRGELEASGADWVIDHPKELVAIVRSLEEQHE